MIFCVEDDVSIRDLMIYALETSGHEACGFNDGGELFEALASKSNKPELIMLDIMLPGEDGMEILKKLKANPQTSDIPVIMATAKGTEFDKVIGLDTGADDYLTKPFGMMEMIARVNAVLRRFGKQADEDIIEIGEISINAGTHIVTVDGENVALTLKEFELLQTLMRNPEHVFSRENLLSEIWGMDYTGETRTVDVHIGTLRTKLGSYGKYIETVRGVGYRFRYEKGY
ncbi:MAG: response regulator transcription factor [Firmicutes bacterium]|nr:response regulator transcription factor [Bacillota bacterium]